MSRINSWLFLDYEAHKIGSFIFESLAGQAVARNKTNINITRGWLINSPSLDLFSHQATSHLQLSLYWKIL